MHSLRICAFTPDFKTMRRINRVLPLKRPHPGDVQNCLRLEDAIDMSGMIGLEDVEEEVEVEIPPQQQRPDAVRVMKPQVKWDEIAETVLMLEVNSDCRCMRVARPKNGMKTIFWKEVAEAMNKHAVFRNCRVSDKSCKEHYWKMIEKQKDLMKNPQYRSGSAENSGPNALDLEDNIRGNISVLIIICYIQIARKVRMSNFLYRDGAS